MKSLVSITIILILWSKFSTAQLLQGSTPVKYIARYARDQPTLQQYRVAKRQTGDERANCNAQLSEVLCTAGIQQAFVEAGLSCSGTYSDIDEAQKSVNLCAKSEDGQFCGSLLELNMIKASYIEGNCSGVLRQNSCPSNCRSLLEDFRSTLGCCINAYVNSTGLYSGATSLDYRVWNFCDVPLPPAPCGNGPTINPPFNVQNCTDEDLFDKYYVNNRCLPERRKPYTDVLKRLGPDICGTDITPSSIEDECSVDTNGVPCGTLYYRSIPDLVSLDSACSTSSVSCTSECRDGIAAAKNRYGCCFRSVWFTTSGPVEYRSPSYLSSSVLKSCDIELPGTCKGLIGSAVSTMKDNCILLIIAGLMCLQLMVLT